jgi:biotin-(acetyl-CoA carboxylase) ligase
LTTLRDLSGQIHPHEHLLLELLEHCKDVFSLAVPYPDRVASEAHRWCLQKGHLLKVQTTGGVIDGLCEGIGSRGELLLRTSDGLRRIFSGSILR